MFSHNSLDSKSAGRQSVASNMTKPDPEDDADSMAEYGEGDTGKKIQLNNNIYTIPMKGRKSYQKFIHYSFASVFCKI